MLAVQLGFVALVLLTSQIVFADSMVCHGPGQTYSATLDRDHRTMVFKSAGEPIWYKIADIDGPTVSGATADDGSTPHAIFDGKRRVELYFHGKLMKTDVCHRRLRSDGRRSTGGSLKTLEV